MAVLVTGGAGYIGSHAVRQLSTAGHEVVVFDNLVTGHREAVGNTPLVEDDLLNTGRLTECMVQYRVDRVLHFAANSLVGESMSDPEKYYRNNVAGTLSLLTAMRRCGADCIVFSSSAATYGMLEKMPIGEDAAQKPVSVYGTTKLIMEKMLADFDMAYGIRHVALRYFNVAGADPSGEIGEDHRPETHLIPIVLQTVLGMRDHLDLFGNDYPTPDGTCIRDYIHVSDLVDAHILALKHLAKGGKSRVYNLGNGRGFSNREIIRAAEEVTGKTIEVVDVARRPGDPPTLIASSDRISAELGWKPRHTKLEDIVATAWRWHESHPGGYGS
jgi:UDP-glucose 4-epimerase